MAQNNFFFIFNGSKEEQLVQIDEKIRTLSAILAAQEGTAPTERLNDLINELYEQKEEAKRSKD